MVSPISISPMSCSNSMLITRSRLIGEGAKEARDKARTVSCQLCSAEFSKRGSPRGRVFRSTPFNLSTSRMKSITVCSDSSRDTNGSPVAIAKVQLGSLGGEAFELIGLRDCHTRAFDDNPLIAAKLVQQSSDGLAR